jgi:CRP-like cAMP-binding protein
MQTDNVLTGAGRIPLMEVEPSLADHLPPDGRELGRRLTIPVGTVPRGDVDPDALLGEAGAFAAVILEGLLMHRVAIDDQPALRLMGPGDFLTYGVGSRSPLLAHAEYHAAGPVRVAMLGDRVLWLAQRFPRLVAGLQTRMAEQHERVAVQLAICQLPRVEDRLMAMLWLIAETWGRVTTGGTLVPVSLTHDALGELVGARRSTVSLALKQLVEDGVLVRNDGGWLLLKPFPAAAEAHPLGVLPQLIPDAGSNWTEQPAPPPGRSHDELSALVRAMSESHQHSAAAFESRLDRSRQARERNRALRDMIAQQRIAKQRPPRRLAPSG